MRFHCANQHHISIEIKLLINCHLQRSQMPGTKQIQWKWSLSHHAWLHRKKMCKNCTLSLRQ